MKKTGMKLLAGVLFGALLAGCSAGQPEAGESAAPSASPVAEQPESIGAADAGRSGLPHRMEPKPERNITHLH